MSKYTTEIRFICENACGLTESAGYSSVSEVIASAIPNIFDFDFPIYDESYRNVLCTKILKHYYTREISAETVGLWKLWLDTRLNEIMPYYNQLYKSAMIEFNPLYDVDITTKHTKDNGGVTDVKSSSENKGKYESKSDSEDVAEGTNRNMYSNTPQGSLDNVENETYLTDARKITDNSTSTKHNNESGNSENNGSTSSTTKIDNTEEYIQTVVGKRSGTSYARRLVEFRQTFLNIDKMIIDDLADLFMNLW